MFKAFYPDFMYDSAYEIDYQFYFDAGFRNIIYDIDNTLVPHGAPADTRSKELIKNLKSIGFKVLVLSNNKEPRVKNFAEAVGALYIYKANKPSKKGFSNALLKLEGTKENTLFIGDQLFTDVYGGKRSEILSLLVKPIDKHEEIQIVLKRRLEAIVLFFYRQSINKSVYPIVLTGFMGCGKSTLGKILAKELSIPFIDLDDEIVKREGKSIPLIFKEKGEKYFREVEYKTCKDLLGRKAVIASGGGIITYPKSYKLIKKSRKAFYLKTEFDTLYERIKGDSNRPLSDSYETTKERFTKRIPLYEGSANIIIDCNVMDLCSAKEEVIRRINENTCC